jgi:hypothetical protein
MTPFFGVFLPGKLCALKAAEAPVTVKRAKARATIARSKTVFFYKNILVGNLL